MIVSKFMNRLVPDSAGELYLYSNSRDVLDGACEWGQERQINDFIAPDSCWSLRRGRAYDFSKDTLSFLCDHKADGAAPARYICIPVIAHGDTVGLLHIDFPPKLSHADVKTFSRFASRAAEHIFMAIANVKLRDELHDQSVRDPLTGLCNRRYFMDALRREATKADRGGQGFGLISFDADKFKVFNDNHGHESGDMVLRALADCMHACLPDKAVHARVGGEEFAVLVPDCGLDQALIAAETLREAVAKTDVRTAFGLLPKVTISAGVVAYCGDGTSPSALIKQADEALYAAKHNGRNRVEAAAVAAS